MQKLQFFYCFIFVYCKKFKYKYTLAFQLKLSTNNLLDKLIYSSSGKAATWSMRELVDAALCRPGTVGWSGIVFSHLSSPALNVVTEAFLLSRSSLGIRLNNLAPFTFGEDSMAARTLAGAAVEIIVAFALLLLLCCFCVVAFTFAFALLLLKRIRQIIDHLSGTFRNEQHVGRIL